MKNRTKYGMLLTAVGIAAAGVIYACGGDDSTFTPGGADSGGDGGPIPLGEGGSPLGDGGSGGDGSTSPCLGGNCIDVLTEHYDNARTGLYVDTKLTPTNVKQATFGKLFELSVDGKVDAQPLYVQNVMIGGTAHNVIYIVTEHDSLYAFDAEAKPDAGASPLWGPVSMIGASETASDAVGGCTQVMPEIGITSTPVIDPATSTIYLIAMTKNGAVYHQRLHALDITSGAEKSGSPKEITANYPGSGEEGDGGTLAFNPKVHKERSALLLDHGQVWMSWSSHCDQNKYTGWMMAYDETTLAQTAVFNDEPNGSEAAFWSSGAGPAADSAGNIYHETGNGGFETTLNASGFPNQNDYGNSFIKVSLAAGKISLLDYFTEGNEVVESMGDVDLSSGGLLLLPDSVGSAAHRHLLAGGGKDGHIYLLDRDNLGKFNTDGGNGQIAQDVPNATFNGPPQGGVGSYGAPAYFNGAIYYGGVNEPLKRWAIANANITVPQTSQTAASYGYPGTTPTVSYNGTDPTTGIVWAHENSDPPTLHAYSPADLTVEYYNSTQASGLRDQPSGGANKFIIPTVANGRVYFGTTNSVVVYGLL